MTVDAIKKALLRIPQRSYWDRGVTAYAYDLLGDLPEDADVTPATITTALLQGARDWRQYSYGGCALCNDMAIAMRLCTPSERRRVRYGMWRPNRRESWMDVQTRALTQAHWLIERAMRDAQCEDTAIRQGNIAIALTNRPARWHCNRARREIHDHYAGYQGTAHGNTARARHNAVDV